jgi:hypothetical protein
MVTKHHKAVEAQIVGEEWNKPKAEAEEERRELRKSQRKKHREARKGAPSEG